MSHFEKLSKLIVLLFTVFAFSACDNVQFSKSSDDPSAKSTSFEVGPETDDPNVDTDVDVDTDIDVDTEGPVGPDYTHNDDSSDDDDSMSHDDRNRMCRDREHGKKRHHEHKYKTGCKGIDISKIIVNIDGVYAQPNEDVNLLLAGGQYDILNNMPLLILPSIPFDINANQIRIELAPDGNVIIDSNGMEHDLKTPSAQQSGLKVSTASFDGVLMAGESYLIRFQIDPMKQVVGNKKKCILKPVIKNAEIKNTKDEF